MQQNWFANSFPDIEMVIIEGIMVYYVNKMFVCKLDKNLNNR